MPQNGKIINIPSQQTAKDIAAAIRGLGGNNYFRNIDNYVNNTAIPAFDTHVNNKKQEMEQFTYGIEQQAEKLQDTVNDMTKAANDAIRTIQNQTRQSLTSIVGDYKGIDGRLRNLQQAVLGNEYYTDTIENTNSNWNYLGDGSLPFINVNTIGACSLVWNQLMKQPEQGWHFEYESGASNSVWTYNHADHCYQVNGNGKTLVNMFNTSPNAVQNGYFLPAGRVYYFRIFNGPHNYPIGTEENAKAPLPRVEITGDFIEKSNTESNIVALTESSLFIGGWLQDNKISSESNYAKGYRIKLGINCSYTKYYGTVDGIKYTETPKIGLEIYDLTMMFGYRWTIEQLATKQTQRDLQLRIERLLQSRRYDYNPGQLIDFMPNKIFGKTKNIIKQSWFNTGKNYTDNNYITQIKQNNKTIGFDIHIENVKDINLTSAWLAFGFLNKIPVEQIPDVFILSGLENIQNAYWSTIYFLDNNYKNIRGIGFSEFGYQTTNKQVIIDWKKVFSDTVSPTWPQSNLNAVAAIGFTLYIPAQQNTRVMGTFIPKIIPVTQNWNIKNYDNEYIIPDQTIEQKTLHFGRYLDNFRDRGYVIDQDGQISYFVDRFTTGFHAVDPIRCDTLNLNTNEVIQKIGVYQLTEEILNGATLSRNITEKNGAAAVTIQGLSRPYASGSTFAYLGSYVPKVLDQTLSQGQNEWSFNKYGRQMRITLNSSNRFTLQLCSPDFFKTNAINKDNPGIDDMKTIDQIKELIKGLKFYYYYQGTSSRTYDGHLDLSQISASDKDQGSLHTETNGKVQFYSQSNSSTAPLINAPIPHTVSLLRKVAIGQEES